MLSRLLIVVPAVVLLSAAPVSASEVDADILGFETAQQAAWNAHDAAAYAATLADNAEVVSAQGWHWSGRAEVARNLADGFRFVYAGARLDRTVMQVRRLSPEVATVMLRWSLTGARRLDSGQASAIQTGFEIQVLQRQGNGWTIVSQQDTLASVPPAAAPLPTATAPAPATRFPIVPPPMRRCILGRANGECMIYGKPKPGS